MTTELRELVAIEARMAGLSPGLWAPKELAEARARPPFSGELIIADAILAIPRIAAALKLLDEQERLMLGGSVGTRG